MIAALWKRAVRLHSPETSMADMRSPWQRRAARLAKRFWKCGAQIKFLWIALAVHGCTAELGLPCCPACEVPNRMMKSSWRDTGGIYRRFTRSPPYRVTGTMTSAALSNLHWMASRRNHYIAHYRQERRTCRLQPGGGGRTSCSGRGCGNLMINRFGSPVDSNSRSPAWP